MVNPRCRIITFEGANEQANWRMEGAFSSSSYTIQEQFYPSANCQNLGLGNPYTDGGYYRDNWPNGYTMRRCTTSTA